jgi:hypothetical protein
VRAVCGVRCAVCGVRCAVCGVRCAVCGAVCASDFSVREWRACDGGNKKPDGGPSGFESGLAGRRARAGVELTISSAL